MSYERTNGPWVWEVSKGPELRLYGDNAEMVLEVSEGGYPSPEDSALIEAAPALAAALRVMLELYVDLARASLGGDPETQPQVREARAILTKAKV